MKGSPEPKIIKVDANRAKLYHDTVLGTIKASDLVKEHGFSKSAAHRYMKKVRDGVPVNQAARMRGRPCRLDPETCVWIKSQIEAREKVQMAPIAGDCDTKHSIGKLSAKAYKDRTSD